MASWNDSTAQAISPAHQAVYGGVWFVALLVNVTNCFILGRTAYVQRSCPNVLCFMLTVADVWVMMAGLLPSVIALFVKNLLENYSGLCSYQAVIINSWYIVASGLVVLVAFDRHLAVCYPFYYSRRIAGAFGLKAISFLTMGLIILAVLLACLPLILGRRFRVLPPGIYCFLVWSNGDTRNVTVTVVNLVFGYTALFLVFSLTVTVCYGIYKMIYSGRKRTSTTNLKDPMHRSQNALEIMFAKLGIVMAIAFSASTLPLLVSSTIFHSIGKK